MHYRFPISGGVAERVTASRCPKSMGGNPPVPSTLHLKRSRKYFWDDIKKFGMFWDDCYWLFEQMADNTTKVIHIGPSKTTRFVIYDMKPPTFTIAYHRLNIQLCSWPLLSKQKKIRGFRKCKVHCCNFKGFKVTNLQSSASPGFEPGTPAWASFPMISGSRGGPGFESQRSRTLKIGNFEALEVTAMYFTFSETSHLPLIG